MVASTGPAAADVPPPPDYVETCTLEEQQKDGDECRACAGSRADEDGMSAECQAHRDAGLEKRCQTYGASVWQEIWCKEITGSAPATPKDAEGCAAAPGPVGAFAAGLLLLASLRRHGRLRPRA